MADDSSLGATTPTPTVTVPGPTKIDKITLLLFYGTLFFAVFLVIVDKVFPNDGQVFQVLASLTAGFAGAFFARINPHPSTSGTTTLSLPGLPKSPDK